MIKDCEPYQIADAISGTGKLLALLQAHHDFNMVAPPPRVEELEPEEPEPVVALVPTEQFWFSVEVPLEEREPQFQDIGRAVCRHFKMTRVKLRAKRRTKDITYPRQIAMYLGREHTRRSMPEIARLLGISDHTTVLYGANKIGSLVRSDWMVAYDVAHVEALI